MLELVGVSVPATGAGKGFDPQQQGREECVSQKQLLRGTGVTGLSEGLSTVGRRETVGHSLWVG